MEQFSQIIQGLNRKDPSQYNRVDVEILHLCGFMLSYMKDQFSESTMKIELIGFCWNMLKNEEKTIRYMAYIFACKFINNFRFAKEKTV